MHGRGVAVAATTTSTDIIIVDAASITTNTASSAGLRGGWFKVCWLWAQSILRAWRLVEGHGGKKSEARYVEAPCDSQPCMRIAYINTCMQCVPCRTRTATTLMMYRLFGPTRTTTTLFVGSIIDSGPTYCKRAVKGRQNRQQQPHLTAFPTNDEYGGMKKNATHE